MTTSNDNIGVNIRETGGEQTRRSLRQTAGAVSNLAGTARRSFSPLLGLGLISGLLGGGLLALGLSSGVASNAMFRLQSSLEALLQPLVNLLIPAIDLFSRMPVWAQYMLLLAGAAIILAPSLIKVGAAIAGLGAPVLLAIGAGLLLAGLFYFLITRSETFRNVFASVINLVLTDFKNLVNGVAEGINIIRALWDGLEALFVSSGLPTVIANIAAGLQDVFAGNFASGLNRLNTALNDIAVPRISAFQQAYTSRRASFRQPISELSFSSPTGNIVAPDYTSLSPLENNILDFFRDAFAGQGGAPLPATQFAPGSVTTNNYFGLSVDEQQRRVAQFASDPNAQGRLNGGP